MEEHTISKEWQDLVRVMNDINYEVDCFNKVRTDMDNAQLHEIIKNQDEELNTLATEYDNAKKDLYPREQELQKDVNRYTAIAVIDPFLGAIFFIASIFLKIE